MNDKKRKELAKEAEQIFKETGIIITNLCWKERFINGLHRCDNCTDLKKLNISISDNE